MPARDPLPQTEMSAYNRILEISFSVHSPHPLFLTFFIIAEWAAYCVHLVRRSYIVLLWLCYTIHTIMIEPQGWSVARQQEDDRTLTLPSLRIALNISHRDNRIRLQELDVAASLQNLRSSTPRYAPPSAPTEWVSSRHLCLTVRLYAILD